MSECPYEAEVNLLLDYEMKQIHQMNQRIHRGIDRPTDVLSFPMVEYEEAGQFDFLEDQYGLLSIRRPESCCLGIL